MKNLELKFFKPEVNSSFRKVQQYPIINKVNDGDDPYNIFNKRSPQIHKSKLEVSR